MTSSIGGNRGNTPEDSFLGTHKRNSSQNQLRFYPMNNQLMESSTTTIIKVLDSETSSQ